MGPHAAFRLRRTPALAVEAHQRDHLGALANLAHGAILAHLLAHPGIREPMRSLIVAGRGVILFGSWVQVLGAGNTESLLDRVGDFKEHWTQDDGWHGAGW